MITKAFTSNGTNRFLVLSIEKKEHLKDLLRFTGGRSTEIDEDTWELFKIIGGGTVTVGSYVLYTGGDKQKPIEVGPEILSQEFKVYDSETFKSIFREAQVGR